MLEEFLALILVTGNYMNAVSSFTWAFIYEFILY